MPTVAVLICTYKGEKYLGRQLDTIVAQTHTDWVIHASDDGSSDGTLALLKSYQQRLGEGRLHIYDGPRQGFAANFLSLIRREAVAAADYHAFTDQDDEWDPSKLERAIAALAPRADRPAMYGSRSELIDFEGRRLGYSPVFTKPPGFDNALVQNMVSGNTMVLNKVALELMNRSGLELQVSAHDWWAYLLVTGSGGEMIYDTYPTIRYRQHGSNLYGENRSLRAKWVRIKKLFAGDFKEWNTQNLAALRRNWALLTRESQQKVEAFERLRTASAPARLRFLLGQRVYRQTWDGQLGLLVAALTRKI